MQMEDDTSSANNTLSGMGAPSASQLDSPADAPQMSTGVAGLPGLMTAGSIPDSEAFGEEEANKKDTAAADDLRELAAKGVCAPLWRTNQPVQPVSRPCLPACLGPIRLACLPGYAEAHLATHTLTCLLRRAGHPHGALYGQG